ncbi:type I polyketide synthase [Lentzea nigeriaca]|uniref:type I polyketide synthase n=1 Tax=Lentzea nigeriaca TaxID=1128665 RepID=UPI00195ABF3E|nr:type I polyketide synthase [Lentzea nigeriaca]MBM7859013.1 acyl transferase domain-containing protein/NAD(P)H-dependent flavin oxidoreductase YrpB (nitropropane dioxygenase family)/acyl carrier protein/NADP-dependent 3-hydroxy acid dehydrogenase YdfG [Lentzea nigeriaca]
MLSDRERVLCLSPFGTPNPALVVAAERAGGLGVLDLGPRAARDLERVVKRHTGSFAVRLHGPLAVPLPDAVDAVVVDLRQNDLTRHAPNLAELGERRVLAVITSVAEAVEAIAFGATGLIAKGAEAGGRVGGSPAFVLLQQVLALTDLPVWLAGSIGPDTAAAAVAGGARGVVLEGQLTLVAEARKHISGEIVNVVRAMDGADTVVNDGVRVHVRQNTLEIGQEGAFAEFNRVSFGTVGGVVGAIRRAIRDNVALAGEHRSIRVGGPFCERVPGLRYPIAQGPMTRVSDQPAFAAAVAEGGALPFLALALTEGQAVRELLDDTAEKLGDRPWGVGLLGFAPPELRARQLEAVLAVRPKYAIVAGGTPAQARELEDAGIEAFLHVPSPALLRRFLDEGARKFVFEGSECGGHTGPRTSFTLWQQQIDVLRGREKDVTALFAGGIHDARSAAMISALTAPLAARGAAIGVLVGTAYLFTEEAVTHGAIQPVFQQVALECEDTALLETSPGHAVRCAQTSYVDTFEQKRAELAGLPKQESWEQLEQLNLGRLRLASRGLVRADGGLKEVGEDEQRREGMFMIGQVATLRSERTTIARLHEDIVSGVLPESGEDVVEREPLDIAIVGMAAIMPGARDVAEFWANILKGTDSVTEIPPDRWSPERYDSPFKWGGFIPRTAFDPLAYGIPPASLTSIEPAQLLALEVSARALKDAGYATRVFDRERASVIFGAEAGADLANAYTVRSALPALGIRGLDDHLPALTEDSFPGVLGNVISGRVANRLDLGGANYTVDAACASSLAALDVACKELVGGTSDMVLCGAVDLHNSAHDYQMFASVKALSAKGRCATFDSAADGIALGEGVACVVLKRLADAERDGDRVYAVIKGIGASSDGRSLGLTAPRPEGQQRALRRAYASAGLPVTSVGLVEAHGTGTVVGDRTELASLTEMFSGVEPGTCTIGSVKSQIGHTKCAAGLAGVIKAALAVHTGLRPGTLHVKQPNAFWDARTSPFAFGHRTWAAPVEQRVAGVSAFGFGGTNFHTVVAGYAGADEPRHGLTAWPAELFLIRGDDQAAAQREAARLRALVDERTPLRSLAAACGVGTIQAAFVVSDHESLRKALADVEVWRASDVVRLRGGERPKIAFLYPGQGSQRPGMLLDLVTAFPRLQEFVDARYERVMYPPTALTAEDVAKQRAEITDTRMAQPTLGIAGLMVTSLLDSVGVRPDLAGGHSYGELVALAAAGVFEPADLLALSAARAEAMLDAVGEDPGTMAAVSAPLADVEALLPADVVVANHNAPDQVVISGPTSAVGNAVEVLRDAGLSVKTIPVAAAFHSPLMAGARDRFAARLAAMSIGETAFPVWSNVTAAPHTDVREGLSAQLAGRVRFVDQIESMYAAGARIFVEAGPGGVLTSLVGKTLGDRPHQALRCDDHETFLRTLAELAVAGVEVDAAPLFEDRAEPATAVPQRPGWYVDGGLVRDANGDALPGGLRPATEFPTVDIISGRIGSGPGRDEIVEKFLDGMRDAVSAQRDVLLSYLGNAPVAPAPLPVVEHVKAPEPQAEPRQEDVATVVLRTISARTGYPVEMLQPGLDLEADLSIDSIKRTEIVGELAQSLGAPGSIDELAQLKTIDGIVGWFGAAPAPAPAGKDVRAVVLRTISTRTGYPVEMLQPGLDLEADLSIDSIKRAEIVGELAQELGATGSVDELAALKTIDGIVGWFGVGQVASASTTNSKAVVLADAPTTGRLVRLVPQVVPCEPAEPADLAGKTVLIVDDNGIGLELADLLERHTARPRIEPTFPDDLTGIDVVVRLGGRLPEAFSEVKACVTNGVSLLVVTTGGGTFGFDHTPDELPADIGLHGLIRTAALEYPDLVVRAVDVNTKESHRDIATALLTEIGPGPAVVGYHAGRRQVIEAVPAELGTAALDLDADSVVLLTGGARGITALAATALAERTGCHVELIGRTPITPEDHRLTHATTEPELVKALFELGETEDVPAKARKVLAEREVRRTMERLRAKASSVRYHECDVTDAQAVAKVVDDIKARFGRLDGVIHGAGVLDDKLIADKTQESFDRVWATKVNGAKAFQDGFLVLFGSVSGVFGNRGQADYSAANDALDRMARFWGVQRRVVAVDWGPWAGAGMAVGLAGEYARRGIPLIDPEQGVDALLNEIASGSDVQVVYRWEA